MKVLFSDITYSYLFPGGKQVHAEKLFSNLQSIGVDIQFENWHDPNLQADIVHFFGYNDFHKIIALKRNGYKLVYTHIMDGLTNQPEWKLKYHVLKNKILRLLPNRFNLLFPWKILNSFDAIVYMHQNDRNTAIRLYNIDMNKTHIIPHAVDSLEPYLINTQRKKNQNKYLVSLGSIVERKNAVFTAEACIANDIPIKFIGHPFDEKSDYFKKFIELTKDSCVEYLGYLTEDEKIEVLKEASGFVLLSFGESGCISVYEAAATGLPLLLSDLPWAKGYEKPLHLYYCSATDKAKAKKQIKDFFEKSQKQNYPTFEVHTWNEIAQKYNLLYTSLKN